MGDFLNILMLPVEVRGFWHWIDYLVAEAKASGKEPLFLNLDETSISQWWSQPKGCVVSRKRWRDGVPPKAGVPANRRRGAVTLCALITHKTDVQPFLPQLVLGNKRILPPSFCAEVSAGPAKFWSEASGWMTHAVLLRYLSLLTEVLHGLPQYRPVLIMDCAPAHMSAEILAFARDNGLRLCFVPGGCTGHVQPLDVMCFSPLKAFLRREARDVLARKASFTKLDWLLTINKAATEFLRGKRWAPVFHQCGVIGDRRGLKGFLSTMAAKYKEVEPAPVIPSPAIISALLPRNRSISYKDLFPEQ